MAAYPRCTGMFGMSYSQLRGWGDAAGGANSALCPALKSDQIIGLAASHAERTRALTPTSVGALIRGDALS